MSIEVRRVVAVKPEQKTKVTIYTDTEFGMGIRKIEAWLIEAGTRKYAQYDKAPYAIYVRRGTRLAREIIKTYKPYLVIVAGWNNPEPHGIFEDGVQVGDNMIQGRYGSHDDRWDTDMDARLEQAGVVVLADFRHTKAVSAY